jgi:tyrosine-protein phosphatase SIW14
MTTSKQDLIDRPQTPRKMTGFVIGLTISPESTSDPDESLIPAAPNRLLNAPLPLLSSLQELSGAPGNFGTVLPGQIHRSQFPTPENYTFLSTLKLKTVVTLVSGPFRPDYEQFLLHQGIRHICIPLPANKEVVCMKDSEMKAVLEIVHNKENQPLLIHCNKGKHRTGCAIACLRRMYNVPIEDVLMEYQLYAKGKARLLDEQFIQEFDVSSVNHLDLHHAAPVVDLEALDNSPMPSPRLTRLRS